MTHPPVDFTVIGGFLGTGKTTLLNRILAASRGVRFAILVNDFGALNIDRALIQHEDSRIMQLANGCICCSLAGGLVDSMVELMRHRDAIDHILIEASGVSYPGRIMDFARIDPDLRPGLTLVLVDADNLRTQSRDTKLAETITAQLDSADMFVLTKTDIASPEQTAWTRDWVADRAPHAPIIKSRPDDAMLVALLTEPAPKRSAPVKSGKISSTPALHDLFKSHAMTATQPVDEAAFRQVVSRFSQDLLRGKGFVRFQTHDVVWQQAGKLLHLDKTDLEDTRESEIVLISSDNLETLKTAFEELGFEQIDERNSY
tara:strand:- start:317 stop:1264 length:948 start_codon:yes stop_codon:yes gene_type:complete